MQKIESKPYGEIEIDDSRIVTIKNGLFGFEEQEKYVIIGKEEEQPFEWLQALGNRDLAFVIVCPQLINPQYKLSISTDDLKKIGTNSTEDLAIYSIVVVPRDPEKMTVNFRGPIIINQNNYIGKQVINQVDNYTVRHSVLAELEKTGREDLLAEGRT